MSTLSPPVYLFLCGLLFAHYSESLSFDCSSFKILWNSLIPSTLHHRIATCRNCLQTLEGRSWPELLAQPANVSWKSKCCLLPMAEYSLRLWHLLGKSQWCPGSPGQSELCCSVLRLLFYDLLFHLNFNVCFTLKNLQIFMFISWAWVLNLGRWKRVQRLLTEELKIIDSEC